MKGSNPNREFKVVYVDGGETEGAMKPKESVLYENVKPRVRKGQEYVKQYLKEENSSRKQVHPESLKERSGGGIDDLETCSVGEGINVNDLQSEKFYNIKKTYFQNNAKSKSKFVINSHKEEILSLINTNEVMVLRGPTGSGKTTQVPQFILDSHIEKNIYCNIVVTQPRRIAAMSVAKRVCEERGWELGKICGYKVGLKDCTSEDTILTYMTIGVLLQSLIRRKNLDQYTHILLDEAHERDRSMDFALIIIKKLLYRSSTNTKIIIMSATIDVSRFANYFVSRSEKESSNAPIIQIKSEVNHAVQIYYLDNLSGLGELPTINAADPRISDLSFDICIRLIKHLDKIDLETEERHSVLVFLPGIYEIEHLYNKLTDPKVYLTKNNHYKWSPLPLHSSITVEEQAQVFRPSPNGYRKIILSTNIAESSITVPCVKFVIDFCLTKRLKNDSSSNFTSLQLCWASHANCTQRAGRVGRLMDGKVYRMVPSQFYETLDEEAVPEILDSPLDRIVLQSKMLDMGEPKAILALALDPPDLSNIEWTILSLKEIGGLLPTRNGIYTPLDGDLTYLGRLMALLPVDIHITKLIIMGHIFSCLYECIIIGASMSLKTVFCHPFRDRLKAYNSKLGWANGSCSDCIALLNIYEIWRKNHNTGYFKRSVGDSESSWAKRHFVQLRVLNEIKLLVDELKIRLKDNLIEESVGAGKVQWNGYQRELVLKIAIAGAFYPNYFGRRSLYGPSEEEAIKTVGGKNPFTTVVLHGFPSDQPMEIYAQLIKKELSDCAEEMRLSSNNCSKIYVEFQECSDGSNDDDDDDDEDDKDSDNGRFYFDAEVPSRIPMAVYRALKIRQIKKHIAINVLPAEEARKRAQSLGISTRSSSGEINGSGDEKLLPCALPEVDVSSINIIITHLISPGNFWAYNSNNLKKQTKLLNILNNPSRKFKNIFTMPSIGDICIAPYEDCGERRFYRARIESVKQEPKPIAEVFFVDYGNYATINVNELKEYEPDLDKSLRKIPAQAFECVLSEIQPSSVKNRKGNWSKKARDAFETMIQGGKLMGTIYSVVNGVLSMELYKIDHGDNQISINQYLLNEGYAEKKEEDYSSQMDHELRMEIQRNHGKKNVYRKIQNQKTLPVTEIEPPPPEECKITIQLRGPTSPLEMSLCPYTRNSLGKAVYISEESVNSVLLNTDPHDSRETLVVAGHISQNSDLSKLVLNDTTLMPNKRGLYALIPFIFAPEIELRANKERTKYIGMLCGLGADANGGSLLPEHDFEVHFDTEIVFDDFTMVNTLRYFMGLLLMTEEHEQYPNISNSDLIKFQRKIRNCLVSLLNREREPMDVQIGSREHKWGTTKSDLIIDTPSAKNYNKLSIFRFHPGLSLKSPNKKKDS